MSAGCTQIDVAEGLVRAAVLGPTRFARRRTRRSPTCTPNPADAQVLHVATGLPRLMSSPSTAATARARMRASCRLTSKRRPANFQRLTDVEWSTQIMSTPPADVGWMAGLVAR